jgi:RNA polymerase sigma-B factor
LTSSSAIAGAEQEAADARLPSARSPADRDHTTPSALGGVPPRPRGAAGRRVDRRRDAADFRAYADRRDARARERLVRAHLPLANAIARRFDRGGRVPLDDLQQVAAVGLIKALDRFDPDHGSAFSSFAVPTMEGELRRYFRDFTWSVRPPRELQERAVRIERERERLSADLGRSPTARELAARIGCTMEEVVDALEAAQARAGDSLDRPAASDDADGATFGDRLGVEDPGFAAAEATVTVDGLLAILSERDALAVRLRFHEDLTQAEIGARIGCSQMQVSRILRAAFAQIAAHASEAPPPRAASGRSCSTEPLQRRGCRATMSGSAHMPIRTSHTPS